MGYLAIAVCCSVAVSLLLKLLRRQHLDIRQTIAAGYPVAVLLTLLLLKPDIQAAANLGSAWGLIAALGILLPLVFVILGRAISTAGMIKADAAQRLSLIIPIIAAAVLFGEVISPIRALGLIIGLMALAALVIKAPTADLSHISKAQLQAALSKFSATLWLMGVFLGYGVIDVLFKQVAKQGTAFPLTLFVSFSLAALFLGGYLLLQKTQWQPKALLFGLVLGVLNVGNIYAYIRAHQVLSESPSIVFTGMNVGVIMVATGVGAVVFHEKLSKLNMLGLILAVVSAAILFLL
ncbi:MULTISPECIES: EamA/RhaT family transporter [Psychrobacter]|uniref:EamA family transporter n=1 Tax=Psychrobacter TaxID=497 RepID=UPI00146D36A8|nr:MULTISPECIES: EamA/RhaT family transporter [Psychrobacter]